MTAVHRVSSMKCGRMAWKVPGLREFLYDLLAHLFLMEESDFYLFVASGEGGG